jgi:hypothetical protein
VAVAVVAMAMGVGLALFQPWKLWVDDTVDQAAPAGASPIAASAATDPAQAPATTTIVAPTAPPGATSTVLGSTTPPAPISAAPRPPPVATAFVSLDHATSGTLLVLQGEGGQRFVRFDSLDTSNGPDLKVYLSTNSVDGPEGAFDDDFVSLGRLQGNVGSQNYEVPTETDLSRYRSVVIWCDRFDSAFGAAPLA